MNDIRKIIKVLIEEYKSVRIRMDLKKIILFGSYAEETYTQDSDIDLLIIKDTDKKIELTGLLR